MEVEINMYIDSNAMYGSGECISLNELPCSMDVLTVIKTRWSIRIFTLNMRRIKVDIDICPILGIIISVKGICP